MRGWREEGDTIRLQRRDIGCDESSVCNSLRWYAAMRCDRLAMSCGRPDGPAVLCHARLHSRVLSALSYRPRTGSSYCLRVSLSSCNLSLLFFFPTFSNPSSRISIGHVGICREFSRCFRLPGENFIQKLRILASIEDNMDMGEEA